ncbi:unnamed protein product [Sphenostylis stenocarpa]|uniref:Uncharacterized protein n=1 Tax=Sphenostylis stenocarpa TaxID=92480 RepID=A0AA86VZ35_9FABA|nr:unnamed protein product [Sphenostylis stenocarpa]
MDSWVVLLLLQRGYTVHATLYYPIAKTLAEKAGWEFAKETGFDVGTALGPLLPPTINSSMGVLVGKRHRKIFLAHILALENKKASGRHLCGIYSSL